MSKCNGSGRIRGASQDGLRVLVIGDHIGHSGGRRHGGTTYFLSTLPALRDGGVELEVCFQGNAHPAAAELEACGIRPTFLGRSKWDPRTIPDLLKIARTFKPDLVHLHTWKSDIVGRIVARRLGIPAVVHVHDTAPFKPILGTVQRSLRKWTAAVAAVSDAVRDFAIREYRIPSERVHTVHHGIELRPYAARPQNERNSKREELNIPRDAIVIGVIGRLVAQKGQLELIAALAGLLHQRGGARLLVVGDGPRRYECERLASRVCPHSSVIFTGQRLDVPAILSAIDIVAMPTLSEEGFGYAALEAIAAGKPVAAFRSGGIPEIVRDGETGLVVEKGDGEALRSAIARLIDDEALRTDLGRNARQHAQNFSLQRHVSRMIEVYEAAIRGRLPARRRTPAREPALQEVV